MLGSSPISAVLGAAPPADAENARLKSYVKAATAAGLALMLTAPGSKIPVDLRSPIQRRKEDEIAQDEAHLAGRADWQKAKSLAGSHLATLDSAAVCRYVDKYRKTYGAEVEVNFALEVGASKLVVVDCDTTEQREAFLQDAGIDFELAPTVSSPGAQDKDGNWVHYDGGHFYFTVPEGVDLPEGTGSWTAPGGYAVLWRDRYILIPPSVRAEGSYVLAGREYPLPEWLLDRITEASAARVKTREPSEGDEELGSAIDQWAETVTWADILAPAGWSLTSRTDKCGCDVWTAPGDHGSPKSATTHDSGCTLGRYTTVNAPMHIWTDNPGEDFEKWISQSGSKTLSKLQAVAVTTYKADVGTACAEIGVITGGTAIEADMGVSSKNAEAEAGVDVSNLDDEITVEGSSCPHESVSKIGRCFSCGVEVVTAQAVDESVDNGEPLAGAGEMDPSTGAPEHSDEGEAAFQDVVNMIRFCDTCEAAYPVDQFSPDGSTNEMIHYPTGEASEMGHSADLDGYVAQPRADEEIQCAGCGTTGVGEDFYRDADGNLWHKEADGEDHEADMTDEGAAEALADDGVLNVESNGVPKIAPFSHWRGLPAPEYAIEGLIEHRALSCIIGPPGVGKSTLAIDLACHLVTGRRWQGRRTIRQKVLYLPGEGLSGAVERIGAWEKAHDADVGEDLLVGNAIIQLGATKDDWSTLAGYILKHRVGMIIFDTFARMSLGLEENSASDVGKAITRFDQIRKLTGAGVMVIHHTGKVGTSGRGSNALNGALDSELLIQPGQWDASQVEGEAIEMSTTKQKNAPRLREPIPLLLSPFDGSVILTNASGTVGDPLDSVVVAPLLVPEPVVETAIRLKAFAAKFPEQGVSRAEFVVGVMPDEYTQARKNADMRWKLHVAEAVDLGIRYSLLETVSGKRTGTRYISSVLSDQAARQRAADEAMED